jgi:hypothetical protein
MRCGSEERAAFAKEGQMKWSLCQDCGWVCEEHPGARGLALTSAVAVPEPKEPSAVRL